MLIVQVRSDKALIHKTRGCLLSMSDFGDRVEDLVRNRSNVIYKPHPYAEFDDNQNLLKRFPSIIVRKTRFQNGTTSLIAARNHRLVYLIVTIARRYSI